MIERRVLWLRFLLRLAPFAGVILVTVFSVFAYLQITNRMPKEFNRAAIDRMVTDTKRKTSVVVYCLPEIESIFDPPTYLVFIDTGTDDEFMTPVGGRVVRRAEAIAFSKDGVARFSDRVRFDDGAYLANNFQTPTRNAAIGDEIGWVVSGAESQRTAFNTRNEWQCRQTDLAPAMTVYRKALEETLFRMHK